MEDCITRGHQTGALPSLPQAQRAEQDELDHQDLHLGLFRSDYLIHATAQPPAIKQVEFNTISSSFGALASRVSELHRYLLQSGQYPRHPLLDSLDKLPPNAALKALSAGLAAAHKAYNKPE